MSAGAVGTSTFAWYTAVRTRSLTISQMTAASTSANMSVYLSNGYTDITTATAVDAAHAAASIALSTGNTLTDASSDGDCVDGTFAKPMFNAAGTDLVGWYTAATYTPASVKWYHKYELTFMNTGADTVNLFLSKTTAVASVVADTTGTVADSVRFACKAGTNTATYINPHGAAGENVYLPGTAAHTSATTAVPTTIHQINQDYFGGTDLTTNPATPADSVGYIGQIAGSGTLAVTFYAWIEGTDGNTISSNLVNGGGVFSSSLSFYSLTA
ncbi:MAG: hypothetical protein LKJ88_05810 [Bacilli bacterium]|nr:hypothetical protein [Bacilli bacterium]